MRTIIPVRVLLFLGLASLSACSGREASLEPPAPAASPDVAGLPPLPQPPRKASQVSLVADGADAWGKCASAQASGDRMVLQAAPGAAGLGWAIYQFSTTQSAKYAVELRCQPGSDGDAYWLGLADYARGSWQFTGPFEGLGTLPALQAGDYLSDNGFAYAVVVAFDTARVVVDQLELKLSANPPPAAPAGLSAAVLPGSVSLSWDASTAPGLLGYNVYFATQTFSLPEQSTVSRYNDVLVPPTASPALELTELSTGQTYFFRVAAVVADQVESPLSNIASANTNYILALDSVMPTRQYPGFWCYLDGSGFNPQSGGTQVLWNGATLPASELRDVTANGLRFRIPEDADLDAAASVMVKAGPAVSDALQVVAVDPLSRPRAWAHVGKTLYQSYEMYGPGGVATDSTGQIFVAQNNAGRIDVYGGDGSFKTSYVFDNPCDLEISPSGNILVKEGGGPDLWWINKASGALSRALDPAVVDADWDGGEYCAFAPNGSGGADDAYFLSDSDAGFVRKYVGGVQTLKIGEGTLERPLDVDIDGSGNLVVADEWADSVFWYRQDGSLIGKYDGSADLDPSDGELRQPRGIAVTADGAVYVADRERDRVLRLNPLSHSFVSEFGQSGYQDGSGTNPPDPLGVEARFWGIWGMAATPNGKLVVSDDYNQRTGVFDPVSGALAFGLGDYTAPAGEFVTPSSIGVRASDGAYAVLDEASYTVTLLSRHNEVLDLAYLETSGDESDIATGRMGRPGMLLSWRGAKAGSIGRLYFTHSYEALTEYSDDFGTYKLLNGDWGSSPGEFKGAYGLAVDSDELFVADEGNDRVQVFGADGLYDRSINLPDSASFSAHQIALDTERNWLYVLDRPWNDAAGVARFNAATGAYLDRLDTGSVGNLLAVDPAGNIYVYQYYDGYLFAKYAPPASPGGQYTLLLRFGSSGDGDGELRDVQCLSITADGRFIIGDAFRRQLVILVP